MTRQTDPETVVIGYLSDGNTKLEFTSALSAATAYMVSHGIADPTFPKLVAQLPKKSGPRIAVGRNSLVEHFLATGADWLVMLDTDMSFGPDAIDRLLQAAHPQDRPIVGGLAIAGGRDGWFPTLTVVTQEGVISRITDYPPDQLVPVDATGAACLVIHRTVFEKLAQEHAAPWQWFMEASYGEQAVGEDFTFGLRARAAGFPVYVHTGIPFGHCKEVTVTVDWWRNWIETHRVVVTGTGRCGTGYLAALLSALGVDTGHEMVFGPRSVGWGNRRGETSWMALPKLETIRELGDDVPQPHVAHLIRNPLHVVRSLMGIGFFDDDPNPGHRPYLKYLPDVDGDTPLERACRFVVEWNERCEQIADTRLIVETMTGDDLLPVVQAAGGFHHPLEIQHKIDAAPTTINSRPRDETITWADVTAKLRDQAVRYGYDIKE